MATGSRVTAPLCAHAGRVILAAWVSLLGTPRTGSGQAPQPDAACATGRISYVFIDNHSVFDTSDETPSAVILVIAQQDVFFTSYDLPDTASSKVHT